jgi:GT2 family glycosyltransferase
MTNSLKVSIVFTAMEYQIRYLKKLLETIESQTYKYLELVVIDKTKTDAVISAIDKSSLYSTSKIVRDDKPRGFAENYNLGINHAGGSYVFILNLDTMLAPDCVERLVEAAQCGEDIGCISPKILRMDEAQRAYEPPRIDSTGMCLTRFIRHFDRGADELDIRQYDEPCYVFGVTGAGAFYRRECLDAIKFDNQYFDEDFWSYREDVDLSWRIQNYGWKCLYTPRAVMFHIRTLKPGIRTKDLMLANMHSVKNRFLLVINNMSMKNYILHLPTILLRDLIVVSGVLVKEQYSLRAFRFLMYNFPRLLTKRRRLLSKTKADVCNFWFSHKSISLNKVYDTHETHT